MLRDTHNLFHMSALQGYAAEIDIYAFSLRTATEFYLSAYVPSQMTTFLNLIFR